jgi:hypothetical protein
MIQIYLARLEDRHIDDQFVAFHDLNAAKRQCLQWASDYEGRYKFSEPDWGYEPHWKYYLESEIDDGPCLSVEKIELR